MKQFMLKRTTEVHHVNSTIIDEITCVIPKGTIVQGIPMVGKRFVITYNNEQYIISLRRLINIPKNYPKDIV